VFALGAGAELTMAFKSQAVASKFIRSQKISPRNFDCVIVLELGFFRISNDSVERLWATSIFRIQGRAEAMQGYLIVLHFGLALEDWPALNAIEQF